jgi:hypothetical protein
MGLDVLEILCWWLGRADWRVWPSKFTRKREVSDGSYEVLGFLLVALVAVFSFLLWGVLTSGAAK